MDEVRILKHKRSIGKLQDSLKKTGHWNIIYFHDFRKFSGIQRLIVIVQTSECAEMLPLINFLALMSCNHENGGG